MLQVQPLASVAQNLPSLPASTRISLRVVDATFVAVDEELNLIVVSQSQNHLDRYLANTQYDSVVRYGGTALGRDGLMYPTQASLPNRQSIYVLDAGNRRVVLLNPNLRLVREFDFRTTELTPPGQPPMLVTPLHIATPPTGELFVLNQDDNQIFRINRFGQCDLAFAGNNYGLGSLRSPARMLADAQQRVWVLDTTLCQLLVFDLQGIYMRSYPYPSNTKVIDFDLRGELILWTTPTAAILQHIPTGQVFPLPHTPTSQLRQARFGWPGECLLLTQANELYSYAFTAPR